MTHEDFDSDPWLLNTPDFIVDLRDGSIVPHSHDRLMRLQTAVTPVWSALGDYEAACPKWLAYMRHVADSRGTVIPFLQRYGALGLVGDVLDQVLLFMHGVPGTGKSVFCDIVQRVEGSYAMPVSSNFFMRQQDKRTFELGGTVGRRLLYSSETKKGMTFDEQLINDLLGGTKLRAENKGRPFIDFRSVATLVLAGNHKPAFVTSAEESGIDRRLLLLSVNRKIDKVDVEFAQRVVAEEGPAILTWLIEGAIEGYASLKATGSFLGGLEEEFAEAAKQYRASANPHVQWIEAEMVRDPRRDIEAKDAFRSFMRFMQEQNSRFHESKQDFRDALAMLGSRYERRTSGQHVGRLVFTGLRYRNESEMSESGDNVVPFARS